MVTMAKRIEELRIQKGLNRPQLAAALGFPRMAVEKFETGRQTPSQEQQRKLADYFGVPVPYLRGETSDMTTMGDWMDDAFMDRPAPAPAPVARKIARRAAESTGESGGESMADAFLNSKKFQESLREAVLDVLRSPEGQELLVKAVKKSK